MEDKKPGPMTNAEKQRALRQRRLEEGRTEVRGVYAPTGLHRALKAAMAAWLKKHS